MMMWDIPENFYPTQTKGNTNIEFELNFELKNSGGDRLVIFNNLKILLSTDKIFSNIYFDIELSIDNTS